MANDKPTINSTTKELDDIESPEPYVHATRSGKRVTFPDIFDMYYRDAEEFLDDLEHAKRNSDVLDKWLPEADLKKLDEDRLSLRKVDSLVEKVMAHYQGLTGDSGEDDASEN